MLYLRKSSYGVGAASSGFSSVSPGVGGVVGGVSVDGVAGGVIGSVEGVTGGTPVGGVVGASCIIFTSSLN